MPTYASGQSNRTVNPASRSSKVRILEWALMTNRRPASAKAKQVRRRRADEQFAHDQVVRGRGPRRITQLKTSRAPAGRRRRYGKKSYALYLQSAHWRTFRALYRASDHPQICLICNDPEYELHHVTYERLGHEFTSDVVPLCREHHARAHEREKAGTPLWRAHLPE